MEPSSLKAYFLAKGYSITYDRFVQLPAGDLITTPAADAILVESSGQFSITVTPSAQGSTPFTVLVDSLFISDGPFTSVTISDVDGTVPVVRIAGFTKQSS